MKTKHPEVSRRTTKRGVNMLSPHLNVNEPFSSSQLSLLSAVCKPISASAGTKSDNWIFISEPVARLTFIAFIALYRAIEKRALLRTCTCTGVTAGHSRRRRMHEYTRAAIIDADARRLWYCLSRKCPLRMYIYTRAFSARPTLHYAVLRVNQMPPPHRRRTTAALLSTSKLSAIKALENWYNSSPAACVSADY